MTSGEELSLLSLLQSQKLPHHCKLKYRLQWLKQKGALLVIIWSFLVNSVWHFLDFGLINSSNRPQLQPTGIILIGSSLLYPVGGWLADSFLGRHKTIRYSTWIMWLTIITITLYQILTQSGVIKVSSDVSVGIFALLYVFLCIGLGGFQANVIQLGIDQLTEASSTEITSFITGYVFTLFTSGVAFQFINICNPAINTEGYSLFTMLYVAVCVTLAVCVDFIFESCLVKERVPVTTNSVTLIARVVKFAFVNHHCDCRDAGEMGRMHVLDITKHSLGGPFEDEHVEYVKTFLRMLVVIAIATVVGSQIIVFAYAQAELQLRFRDWTSNSCFAQISIAYSDYVFGTIALLAYEMIIYPLCNKCIPSISTLVVCLISVFLSFLRVLAFLGIEIGAFLEQPGHNTTVTDTAKTCLYSGNSEIHFSSLWVLIIGSTEGLYSLLLILAGYQFMWAQAPSSMKGLVIGMMYAFLGLNAMLQSAISAPFLFIRQTPWDKAPLSCGIWYYSIQAVIVLIVFLVLTLLVKGYKQSQRSEVRLSSVYDGNPLEL
jgi:hypothetical protein